jgi:hypothetical protein
MSLRSVPAQQLPAHRSGFLRHFKIVLACDGDRLQETFGILVIPLGTVEKPLKFWIILPNAGIRAAIRAALLIARFASYQPISITTRGWRGKRLRPVNRGKNKNRN